MNRTITHIQGVAFEIGPRVLQGLEKVSPTAKARASRAIAKFHVAAYRRTGGRYVGRSTLLLTTTGRKSGLPRTTALFYLPDGDRQILVGSYAGDLVRHPQWYLNITADPAVTVQVGTHIQTATATVLTGDARAAMWRRVVENWPGYDDYQNRTTRELPVVALAPRHR